MLKINQIKLLLHLKKYYVLLDKDCQRFVSENELATLIRLRYVSRNEQFITLLKKSMDLTENVTPFPIVKGNDAAKLKAAKTSNIIALFESGDIPVIDRLPLEGEDAFIPSNIWRRFRTCIISTSRFLGILSYKNNKIVVFDIGDGIFDWQSYAEYSHFFLSHGVYETKAGAMLLICDDGKGVDIAKDIIKYTYWKRKHLIRNRRTAELAKPQQYSKSKVALKSEYKCAMLAEQQDVMETLNEYVNRETEYVVRNHEKKSEYYINYHNDLLKYVNFIIDSALTDQSVSYFKAQHNQPLMDWKHYISLPEKYEPVLELCKTEFEIVRDVDNV